MQAWSVRAHSLRSPPQASKQARLTEGQEEFGESNDEGIRVAANKAAAEETWDRELKTLSRRKIHVRFVEDLHVQLLFTRKGVLRKVFAEVLSS